MSDPPRNLLIVGRDAPAWIAAAFLQRVLGPAGVQIAVVELPSLLSELDVYAALPSLRSLHDLIGLDEAAVLTAAQGVPMVAQRYSGWGSTPFLHAFDSADPPGSFLSFVQLWAKGRSAGMAIPFEEFSLGAMAARLGRIPSESDDPQALGATYGYHLDASAYAALLRALCVRRGVRVHAGEISHVDRDGAVIRTIHLTTGEHVQADLFVDASGAEAILISDLPGGGLESWSGFLPCDRVLAASSPRLTPTPGFSQITAFQSGWVGLFPLQERTAIVAAFQSSDIDDRELATAVRAAAGVPIDDEVVMSALRPGVRPTSWVGNCVAIGEAAAVLEPLDALQLHFVHVCVAHLINFFPAAKDCALEAEEYSKVVRLHASNLRDFQQAHYRLNGRRGESFWDRASNAAVSDELGQKLRMFEARSAAVLYDEETFEAHSWASMFVGHGLMPEEHDPRVDLIQEQEHIQKVQARLREIAATVPSLPTVDAFLSATLIPTPEYQS